MVKKVKLENIANIQMGVVLSRTGTKQLDLFAQNSLDLDDKKQYMYKSVTLRAINDYGHLNLFECDEFLSKDKLTSRYLTRKNDILLRLFMPLKACLIHKEQVNLVVPSQFCIIRLKDVVANIIMPEYILLIMQTKEFENQIKKFEDGFQLRTVKISSIEKTEFQIPSIDKQQKIIELSKLMRRKEHLLETLVEQQKSLDDIMFKKIINGDI